MHTNTKGLKIAANSFFQQMQAYGYSPKQIIQTVNELLELVTHMIRDHHPPDRVVGEPQERVPEPHARP
jgi:hypothetical protein